MSPDSIRKLVATPFFQRAIIVLIVLAAVLVGLETDRDLSERHRATLELFNRIVIWAFALEAALKMYQYGRHFYRYFYDPWNVADFAITVICLLPIDAQYASVLRLARIFRALRLVTTVPRLQLIVNSMIKSIPSMFYVGVLLLLVFYIYGVMGVHLFGENDPLHFGNLPIAMLTLFRIVTLEEWTAIMDTQMLGSGTFDVYNDLSKATELSPRSAAQRFVAPLYFISFIFFGTMIMLNLFIGIIVGGMSEAQEENTKQHLKKVQAEGKAKSLDDELLNVETSLDEVKKVISTLRLRLENVSDAQAEAALFADTAENGTAR
jgi:voltage-gated sodium channel